MSQFYKSILSLPERTLLNKKLTKAFFFKNFDITATEKKLLTNSVQNMEWLASIKPANANILPVKTDEYAYEEVQVIICTVPTGQLSNVAEKCAALLQKYIPYQLLLIVEDETNFMINTSNKRINLNDASKRTVESSLSTPVLSKLYKNDIASAFFAAINFVGLDKTNMELLYKSYTQAIVQLQTATITGAFNLRTQTRTNEDMANLQAIELLEREIAGLTSQLKKESQLNNKVALNVEIQKKRSDIQEIKNKLSSL